MLKEQYRNIFSDHHTISLVKLEQNRHYIKEAVDFPVTLALTLSVSNLHAFLTNITNLGVNKVTSTLQQSDLRLLDWCGCGLVILFTVVSSWQQ